MFLFCLFLSSKIRDFFLSLERNKSTYSTSPLHLLQTVSDHILTMIKDEARFRQLVEIKRWWMNDGKVKRSSRQTCRILTSMLYYLFKGCKHVRSAAKFFDETSFLTMIFGIEKCCSETCLSKISLHLSNFNDLSVETKKAMIELILHLNVIITFIYNLYYYQCW